MMPLLTPMRTSTVLGKLLDQSEEICMFSYNTLFSRAGRFGTKGLAITFVSSEGDQLVMAAIQARFEVAMTELPESIDPSSYSESLIHAPVLSGFSTLCSVTS